MKPTSKPFHPKATPPSGQNTSSLMRALQAPHSARPTTEYLPQRQDPGVRYVDVRVAVPANSPYQAEDLVGYFQPTSGSYNSPLPATSRRSNSPYGFIPIPKDNEARGPVRFSPPPPPSPYGFRKATPSPSMMSTVTADTLDSSLDSSRMGSPMPFSPVSQGSPSLFRPTPQCRGSPRPTTPRPKTPTFRGRESPHPKTPTGRKSPFPKEDDSARKTRIKTELCMHFVQNRPCPFGANCTYAHGEEELQMTKLLDLDKAGLVDVATYRTKPCITWVMTGSCPFGKRCTAIHDPRVGGSSPSWLPHTETQGNTIETDINVEALHQKRVNEIDYGTPFGHEFSLENDKWSDLYKYVCNIDYAKDGWIDKQKNRRGQGNLVNPIVKLQIALKMRGDCADWHYKFRPQHFVHDEFCMVLQHRAFLVTKASTVVEISLVDAKHRQGAGVVEVHEVAFGPDGDSSVRGVRLVFGIEENDISLCTPAQAKRFRWKRSSSKKDDKDKEAKPSVFDTMDSFEMVRPHDADAYDLTTDILKNRLAVLKAERITNMRERYEALKALEADKQSLQERFTAIREHWQAWSWPVSAGRDKVDKSTPVPQVDGKYEFSKQQSSLAKAAAVASGRNARNIWHSFASHNFDAPLEPIPPPEPDSSINKSGIRLPIFQRLSHGDEVAVDRTLPHISRGYLESDKHESTVTESQAATQEEHCWKALLLSDIDRNEWEIVREHFEKSRSKKILSIIQSRANTSAPPGL